MGKNDLKKNLEKQQAIQNNFKEFLQNTSLHGLKYTSDENISVFERIFFIISFVCVLILSGYFISNVYEKWVATPIIISISPTPTYTSSIPFPAVTICSMNQAKKSKVKSIKKGSLEHSLLQSLCARNVDSDHHIPTLVGNWHFFREFVLNVSTSCTEMITYCWFGGIVENCDYLFEPVLTDDGLCCAFNIVAPKFMIKNLTDDDLLELDNVDYDFITPIDWTPEKGYPDILPDNFFPRIAQGTGSAMGLTVILNASSDEYFCSTTQSVGFKILIHNPTTQPKIANYGQFISINSEGRISIAPQIQHASIALRKIDKGKRHCLFANEVNLTYFRTYSRKNCQLECESRLLQEKCGCFLYYMPRLSLNGRLCGPNDDNCINQIQREIESVTNKELSCETCLPACYELTYYSTMTTTRLVQNDFLTRSHYPQEIFNKSVKDITLLSFFYDNNLVTSHTKDELIGFTDFLSNTGGLLGLFMGFSIFSLIEIVYYMTIRPYCAIKKINKKMINDNIRKNGLQQIDKHYWKKKSIKKIYGFDEHPKVFTSNMFKIYKKNNDSFDDTTKWRLKQIFMKNDQTDAVFPFYN